MIVTQTDTWLWQIKTSSYLLYNRKILMASMIMMIWTASMISMMILMRIVIMTVTRINCKVLSNQGDSGVTPETLSQVEKVQNQIMLEINKDTNLLDPPSLSWWLGKSVCDPWTAREVLRNRDQPHEKIFGGGLLLKIFPHFFSYFYQNVFCREVAAYWCCWGREGRTDLGRTSISFLKSEFYSLVIAEYCECQNLFEF